MKKVAGNRSSHPRRVYAANRSSRISSKIRRKVGSGARHIVRYVSRKGSHPVWSLRADFPACENHRHSRGLVCRAESLGGHYRNLVPWIGVFSGPVSARTFLISVLRMLQTGSIIVETGSQAGNDRHHASLWHPTTGPRGMRCCRNERSARRNHETGCHDGPTRSFR